MVAPFHGFNVWLLPITLSTFGPDATYSLRTGYMLYALYAVILSAMLTMILVSPRKERLSSGVDMALGACLYVLGLVGTGWSTDCGFETGILLSQILLCGTGAGISMFLVQICTRGLRLQYCTAVDKNSDRK
jgi:hypothetical protein